MLLQQRKSLLVLLLLWCCCWIHSIGGVGAGSGGNTSDIGGEALEVFKQLEQQWSLNGSFIAVNGTEVGKNGTDSSHISGKASHIVEKLLDSFDDDVQKEAGKFNDTINNQGGVLETVARVGQQSSSEEEESQREHQNESKDETKVDAAEEKPSQVKRDVQQPGNVTESVPEKQSQHQAAEVQIQQPGNVTSVTKVADKKNSTAVSKDNGRRRQGEDVARLIDREDNEYVISHPGKRSQMNFQEDMTLIRDIVTVIVASAFGALVCGALGQPVILGYLAAGMLVGPGGLHLVHELVQVESLAQFGVIFLLFALGVEFSAAKMQGVQAVALGGGCIQILSAMLLGGLLCSSVPQGIFIGAFLSMSSTAVVIKCMMDVNMAGTEPGQILLGTLIFQDCALGLLLAVMPALAAKGSSSWTILFALGRECLMLSGFCTVAWVLAKVFIPRFLLALMKLSKNSSELYQLGVVGVCLCVSLLSQSLGLGLEVGAFVGGLMLSGGPYSEKTLHHVEPVRNIFASLFLASIGMVMHPVFLWQHKDILLASLALMFFGKTFLIAIVVRTFGYSSSISTSVGIALAQIGEFSFVLLSRAQGLGLVSRKLYLLLMGTSAFSLVLTPFAFKIVVRLVPRDRKGQYSYLPSAHSYSTEDRESMRLVKDGVTSNGDKDVGAGSVFQNVTLRRPFSQVFSGQWRDWKELSELRGLYDNKR